MNDFDKIILAVIAVGALVGLFRGFLKEAVGTFGLLFAAVIANLVSPYALPLVLGWFDHQHLAATFVWVVLFIIAVFILWRVASLVDKVMSSVSLGWVNRVAGAVFGGVKYALLCTLVISIIQVISTVLPALSIQSYVEQSQIVPLLHQVVALVMPWVSEHILNPALGLLTHPQ